MTSGIGYPGAFATSVDSGGPVGLDTGYIRDCKVSWLSVTQVQIATGVCRSDDDTTDIQVSGVLTVDITATGANGRNVDTAEAANKWYAIYIIKNTATGAIAGFLINEDDLLTFTWPVGYTKKRRVGWIRNNATSNLRDGVYIGKGSSRYFQYRVNYTELIALSAGSAVVYTNVDISEWVPPTSTYVRTNNFYDPNTGASYFYLRPDGSSYATPIYFSWGTTYPSTDAFIDVETSTSQIIEYLVGNAADDLYIYIAGFYDEV
jgi:hypothetical protein